MYTKQGQRCEIRLKICTHIFKIKTSFIMIFTMLSAHVCEDVFYTLCGANGIVKEDLEKITLPNVFYEFSLVPKL